MESLTQPLVSQHFFSISTTEDQAALPRNRKMPAITTPTKSKATPYARPNTTPSPPSLEDMKPDLSTPNSSARKAKAKAKGTPSPHKTTSKPWTGEELKTLLRYALKNGAPGGEGGWEGVVPDRVGSQCRSAWRSVLVLFFRYLG